MNQRSRRKDKNSNIRQHLKQRIDAVTPLTNTLFTRNYLGQVRKCKKRKLNNIRRGSMGLIRRVMISKYEGRTWMNQSKNATNIIVQKPIFNNKISLRQPSGYINQATRKVTGLL